MRACAACREREYIYIQYIHFIGRLDDGCLDCPFEVGLVCVIVYLAITIHRPMLRLDKTVPAHYIFNLTTLLCVLVYCLRLWKYVFNGDFEMMHAI